MRAANIDMTDPLQQCPVGFKQITRTVPPLRACGRPDSHTGCVSTVFPVHGIEYSRVCGRIIGYQIGTPDAFYHRSVGIDSYYMYVELASHMDNHDNTSGHSLMH